MVPRPRLHLIRFHGVLAPNAKMRSLVVPQAPLEQAGSGAEAAAAAKCEPEPGQTISHRISSVRLLRRVFDIDMHTCPNCGGEEPAIIALVWAPAVALACREADAHERLLMAETSQSRAQVGSRKPVIQGAPAERILSGSPIPACGRDEPTYGSDSSPETCRSWALRGKISECAVKDGLWPKPGLPQDCCKLTLPRRCPGAAKVSLRARPRIAGPGHQLTVTTGNFLASRLATSQVAPIREVTCAPSH
jgi:hypothetical protein